jgi:hypothetical protein
MRILIIHSLLLGAAICSSLNAYDVLNPIGGISPPEPPGPVPASYPHWVFNPNPSHDGTFENAFQDIEYLSRYSRRIHHRGITQLMNGILIHDNEPINKDMSLKRTKSLIRVLQTRLFSTSIIR